jgi:hypothetical protein
MTDLEEYDYINKTMKTRKRSEATTSSKASLNSISTFLSRNRLPLQLGLKNRMITLNLIISIIT